MKLYLIPVPLTDNGLETLSPQIREVIMQTDFYFAENLRTARRFISSLKTGRDISQMTFFELNKNTNTQVVSENFKQIPLEANVGLMSEAGCPAIADPGSLAVSYAHKHQIQVIPMVGPSAILLALMGSGLNGQSFAFQGYLPIEKQEREKAIKNLEKESKQKKQTQLFIETPYRNNLVMDSLINELQGETQICIASNLTSANEWIRTKRVRDWKNDKVQGLLPDLHKQPTIFLILA
jgi:16S rRNA (cytidine1402-2'-O)-methyltransferase